MDNLPPDYLDNEKGFKKKSDYATTPFPKKIIIFSIATLLVMAVSTYTTVYLNTQKLKVKVFNINNKASQNTPTKKSNSTTGWKTYTNTKYNYSLEYPDSPNIKQFTCGSELYSVGGDETFALIPSSITQQLCAGREWYYNLEVQVKKEDINNPDASNNIPGYSKTTTPLKSADNIDGIKTNFSCMEEKAALNPLPCQDFTQADFHHNGFTYTIILAHSNDEQFIPIFDHTLSTFKFTN